MAGTLQAELRGQKELIKKLATLPVTAQRKTLVIALRSAGKTFADAAKRRAARRTGLMAKSLETIKTKTRVKGGIRYKVHPKKGFRRVLKQKRDGTQGLFGKKKSGEIIEAKTPKAKIVNPQRYAHLVELGTKHARERPFMKPAFDARQRVVIKKINGIVGKGIEREARKGATRRGNRG